MSLIAHAQRYLEHGLCCLPAIREQKRPATSSWKLYQGRLPNPDEFRGLFAREPSAICLVTGAVSGHLELLDFDLGGELFAAWSERVPPELLARLVIERSQSGGMHVVYRCESAICGNIKLANREIRTPDGAPVTLAGKVFRPRSNRILLNLIETRGEGGLFLCSPTPGYELQQGDLAEPPTLTAAEREQLLEAAYSLNEYQDATAVPSVQVDNRPGDDFNRTGDPRSFLEAAGWTLVKSGENEHWRRPGKDDGTSATLRDGVFYVFSSNAAPFEPNHGYSPFAVYALLEHAGDHAAAAAELRRQGYGAARPVNPPIDFYGLRVNGVQIIADDDFTPEERPADPGPFPQWLLTVPGLIGRVIEYNLATAPRPQPVLALAGAIALQATLAARKVRDSYGNRTNLYVIGVAPSGAGKEHARKVNKDVLFSCGAGNLDGPEDLASDSGLESAIEAEPAVLFQLDEIGRFLRTIGNDARKSPHLYNVVTLLMKLYSSADRIYKGKAYGDRKRNRSIDQPCAIIYGTTVPQAFYESLTEENLSDGFVGRLLVVEAQMVGQTLALEQELPQDIIEAARWWAEYAPGGNLKAEHPQPSVVPHDEAAKVVFEALREQADAELAKDHYPGQGIWSRAIEKASRLALIYTCSATPRNLVITEQAALWACGLTDYVTRRMLHIAHMWIADGMYDAACKRVLRTVQEAGGCISRNRLVRSLQRIQPKAREELLADLVRLGHLTVQEDRADTCRPRQMYVINRHASNVTSNVTTQPVTLLGNVNRDAAGDCENGPQ